MLALLMSCVSRVGIVGQIGHELLRAANRTPPRPGRQLGLHVRCVERLLENRSDSVLDDRRAVCPRGAAMPYQVVTSNPAKPSSSRVGTSGSCSARLSRATASARSAPLRDMRQQRRCVEKPEVDLPGQEVDGGGRRAFVGHVGELGAGHLPEQLGGEMRLAADADRARS